VNGEETIPAILYCVGEREIEERVRVRVAPYKGLCYSRMTSRVGGGGNGGGGARRRRPRGNDNGGAVSRGTIPDRIPKKPKVSAATTPYNSTTNNNNNGGLGSEDEDDMMDPVAQARKALEMFQEVTGEELDDMDPTHDGDATAEPKRHGYEDEWRSSNGTANGWNNSPIGSSQNNGVVSNTVGMDIPVRVTTTATATAAEEEEMERRNKQLEEENARRRKRKEDGEAQRRAFRPTIATIQDSSCLL
jgi:hypothetical protein